MRTITVVVMSFLVSLTALAEGTIKVIKNHASGAYAYAQAEWSESECIRATAYTNLYTYQDGGKGKPKISGSIYVSREDICNLVGGKEPTFLESIYAFSPDVSKDAYIDKSLQSATVQTDLWSAFRFTYYGEDFQIETISQVSVDLILKAPNGPANRSHHSYSYETPCSVTRSHYSGHEKVADLEYFQIYIGGKPIIPEPEFHYGSIGFSNSGYVDHIFTDSCYTGKG